MKHMSGSSSIKKFILHEEDIYIKEEQEHHKIKESEPFCIFRYMCYSNMGDMSDLREEKNESCENEKVSKYEIFTMEGLQVYDRNRRKINVRQ